MHRDRDRACPHAARRTRGVSAPARRRKCKPEHGDKVWNEDEEGDRQSCPRPSSGPRSVGPADGRVGAAGQHGVPGWATRGRLGTPVARGISGRGSETSAGLSIGTFWSRPGLRKGNRIGCPRSQRSWCGSRVDVIVAAGDASIQAARQATRSIPIVMAVSTDAVERGFVASLARPGGNITGMTAFMPELAGKRIQLLQDILPRARRLGVVSAPIEFHRGELARIGSAARALGLDVQSIEAKDAGAFVCAVGVLAGGGVDAVYVQPSALTDPARKPDGRCRTQGPSAYHGRHP